jgi:hypothetical protein
MPTAGGPCRSELQRRTTRREIGRSGGSSVVAPVALLTIASALDRHMRDAPAVLAAGVVGRAFRAIRVSRGCARSADRCSAWLPTWCPFLLENVRAEPDAPIADVDTRPSDQFLDPAEPMAAAPAAERAP